MVDWVDVVLVALLVFFFGKAEFYKGKFEAMCEERKENFSSNMFHEYTKIANRNMIYFAITLVIVIVRASFLEGKFDSIFS